MGLMGTSRALRCQVPAAQRRSPVHGVKVSGSAGHAGKRAHSFAAPPLAPGCSIIAPPPPPGNASLALRLYSNPTTSPTASRLGRGAGAAGAQARGGSALYSIYNS